MSPQPDTCKPLSACVCVCVCVTPQHLSYWIQTRCWDDNLIPSCSGWAEWVESGLQLSVQCPAKNLQAFLWHNRTPWKFEKCCCINVQLEKPKPLKQSRRAQDWPSWSMVCKPLFPGLTTRWRCPSQSCEKCRYSWKYISHWFLKDLPVKVQTFFPVVSQRVRSGQWYGKGILGLVTGYKEQLLENSSFWTVSVCLVPPSPKGNCTGQVQLVERSQKSHFLLLKDALHVTSCPEVTTLATALAQLWQSAHALWHRIDDVSKAWSSSFSASSTLQFASLCLRIKDQKYGFVSALILNFA